jgi:hypothetical protein
MAQVKASIYANTTLATAGIYLIDLIQPCMAAIFGPAEVASPVDRRACAPDSSCPG